MPSGLKRQRRFGRGACRHHGDAAAAAGQHAQDVALDAEVIGHHVPARGLQLAIAAAQRPFGLCPRVGRVHGHHLGQVQPAHAGGGSGARDRLGHLRLTNHGAGLEGGDAAVLGTVGAQNARQPAGVDAGNGHQALGAQIVGQVARAAEVGRTQRQVLDHQAGGMGLGRFDILLIDTVAADVRIGQCDDLAAVAGVGEDFLVAGQRRIEDHLANGGTSGAHGVANEMRAVCKGQQRGGQDGKQGSGSGFRRLSATRCRPARASRQCNKSGGLCRAAVSAGLHPNCIRWTAAARGRPQATQARTKVRKIAIPSESVGN